MYFEPLSACTLFATVGKQDGPSPLETRPVYPLTIIEIGEQTMAMPRSASFCTVLCMGKAISAL